jgi:hypothetical protein
VHRVGTTSGAFSRPARCRRFVVALSVSPDGFAQRRKLSRAPARESGSVLSSTLMTASLRSFGCDMRAFLR